MSPVYLYAVLAEAPAGALPSGLAGEPVRLVACDGVWAAVGDVASAPAVDEATARTRARERAQQAADGLSAGAGFLTRKRQEHKEVRDIVDLGRTAADEVFEAVAPYADETRRRAPAPAEPGLRLLLDAAFLLPVKRVAAFRESVRKQAERLAAQGYRVVLTGPWPPYNFVAGAR